MPAVLIEAGYLTNPAQELLLAKDDELAKIAQGVAQAIVAFVEAEDRPQPTAPDEIDEQPLLRNLSNG